MSELRKYLQWIVNADAGATVAHFDEDWEPIGPALRNKIVPRLAVESINGVLRLTNRGRAYLAEKDAP